MSNTILIKRSGTANAVPASGNLSMGELAINYTDGNLFYKNGLGSVTVIASNQFLSVTGNVTGANINTTGNVSASGNVIALNFVGNVVGNITAPGANTQVVFNDNGIANATSGFTFNKAANALAVSGNVTAVGNVAGSYFLGNGRLLTGIDTTLISNGTASVQTLNNANITVNPAGTANVAVFASTGAYVTGVTSVTGNVTGGNLLTGGLISATGTITGAAISGTTISGSGNVTGSNINTAGLVSATGNINGSNFNVAGNIVAGSGSGGNITGANVVSANLFIGNVSTTGNITSGNLSTVGNVTANGVLTDNYYYANGSPVDFQQAAGTNTQIQFNDGAGGFGASAAFTFNTASNLLSVGGNASVTGNVTSGNVNTAGLVTATGNVIGGNVNTAGLVSATGNVNTSAGVLATGNIAAGNLLTGGLISATGAITGAAISGTTISGSGNITGANINTAGLVSATGNINGGNVNAAIVSASGNVIANNVAVTSALTSTTVSASGNITGGNISTAANITGANVNTSTLTTITGELTITTAGDNQDINIGTTGNIVLNGGHINNLGEPQQAFDAATKQYVDDSVSAGLTIHTPVKYESPVNLPAVYAQGGTTQTVTTIAGNKTLTFGSSPALQVNDVIVFSSTANGLTSGTAYFVYSTNGGNQVTLSASYNGTEITTLTNGTGLSIGSRANSGVGATLTNSGANAVLQIDGATVSLNDRVLIYTQTNAFENGVYTVTTVGAPDSPGPGAAWVLTRAADADQYGPKSPSELDIGDYFYVQAGSSGAGESYVVTAPTGVIIFGTTNIVFTQFSASQVYTANASAGLTLVGTVFSAKVDNTTTAFDGSGNIVVKTSAQLTTPNIGAATGTSVSVTGNITSGNLSTTLASATTVSATTVSATGNVNSGNVNTTLVAATTLTATGNIVGGNISTAGTANIATLEVTTLANIKSTINSTSASTGALIVAGGIGVVGNVYAGALYDNGTAVLTINSTVDGGTY